MARKKKAASDLQVTRGFANEAQTYTIGSLGDDDFATFSFLSTGVPAADFILKGGYPNGLFAQLYGEDRSGKTLMSLRASREAILSSPDAWVLYIDSEHSITRELCLLNDFERDELKRLYVVHTSVLEDTLRFMKATLTGDCSDFPESSPATKMMEELKQPPALIVWDSVATAISANDYEADPGKKVGYADVPKVLPRRLPQIGAWAFAAQVPIILTNHARESMDPFDTEMKFSGGKHLKHSHFTRLLLSRSHDRKTNTSVHKVNVSKSKLVGDGIMTDFKFAPETGFDYVDALLNGVAMPLGLVTVKGGGYYEWRGNSFRPAEVFGKLGEQIKELVEDVRSVSGVPLLGGRSLDKFIEKRLASQSKQDDNEDEFGEDTESDNTQSEA